MDELTHANSEPDRPLHFDLLEECIKASNAITAPDQFVSHIEVGSVEFVKSEMERQFGAGVFGAVTDKPMMVGYPVIENRALPPDKIKIIRKPTEEFSYDWWNNPERGGG